jgi:hypothetical protein
MKDVDEFTDTELHQAVLDVRKQIDALSAREAQLLREWDVRRIWADDNSRSSGARLSRETGLSVGDAKHLLTRAKKLAVMPLCSEAFGRGELSCSRVDLLTRGNRLNVQVAFARDEAMLLSTIADLRFADASRVVAYWSQCADSVGAEHRANQLVEQRSAHVAKTYEGSVDLRALFDPVNGEVFLDELERLEQGLFEADWAKAKAQYGEGNVTADLLARTPAQRRCDALIQMASRSAGADGQTPRPLISVVVDYGTFSRLCETAAGTVIAPGQIMPLLGQADIERIVFDGKDRILHVGRKRFFRGALRRAIEIRDRHCQDPSGCDVPAKHCDVDHSLAYANGGNTDQTNGRLFCGFHNRAKGSGPP